MFGEKLLHFIFLTDFKEHNPSRETENISAGQVVTWPLKQGRLTFTLELFLY